MPLKELQELSNPLNEAERERAFRAVAPWHASISRSSSAAAANALQRQARCLMPDVRSEQANSDDLRRCQPGNQMDSSGRGFGQRLGVLQEWIGRGERIIAPPLLSG
ncbi:MAG: hypothetical protein ACRDGF_06605 [Chloroflexota bacterium]